MILTQDNARGLNNFWRFDNAIIGVLSVFMCFIHVCVFQTPLENCHPERSLIATCVLTECHTGDSNVVAHRWQFVIVIWQFGSNHLV